MFYSLFSYELPVCVQSDIPSSIYAHTGSSLRNGDVFFVVVFAFCAFSCAFAFFVAFFSSFGVFVSFLSAAFSSFYIYVSSLLFFSFAFCYIAVCVVDASVFSSVVLCAI